MVGGLVAARCRRHGQLDRKLEVLKRIGSGARQFLDRRRLQRRGACPGRFVRQEPVTGRLGWMALERGGDRRVHTPSLVREQVRGEGRGHQLVPDAVRGTRPGVRRARRRDREPLPERLLEAGGKVAVADPGARSRALRNASCHAAGACLVRVGDHGQLLERERAFRQRECTQHAPAVRGPVRDPAQDQLRERGSQGSPGALAPGSEHLLDDERIPA